MEVEYKRGGINYWCTRRKSKLGTLNLFINKFFQFLQVFNLKSRGVISGRRALNETILTFIMPG